MITTPLFNRFRTSEFVQFFDSVATICQQNNPEALGIQTQYNVFKAALAATVGSYKKNSKSNITEQLNELDARRDKAIVCLNTLCEGYLSHFSAEKQEAAERVISCVNKYGSRIYNLNYLAETAVVKGMVDELNQSLAAELTLLALSEVVDELASCNSEFDAKYIERVNETAADNSESTSLHIAETKVAYKTMCQHIDAHAIINPSDAYNSLSDRLNALIGRFNSTMQLRKNENNSELE